MSLIDCLQGMNTSIYGKIAELRSRDAAMGNATPPSPTSMALYRKQRDLMQQNELNMQAKIARDQERIANRGMCSGLFDPQKALIRHQNKLAQMQTMHASIAQSFPPGV